MIVPLVSVSRRGLPEEKTRNGILSTLRIRGELGSAVALDDIQYGVLAQPEPVTYFPVRLAFVDKLEHFGGVTVGLDALTGAPAEHDSTVTSRRNARTDPLSQQIPLKFRQRGHQGGDQFALRAAQIELQAALSDQRDTPGLKILQRVEQIEHRAAPPGKLSEEDYVDTAGLR